MAYDLSAYCTHPFCYQNESKARYKMGRYPFLSKDFHLLVNMHFVAHIINYFIAKTSLSNNVDKNKFA